jgi:CRISPR-associated protein Csb2
LDPRKLLPATRKRDKRTFPAVIPESNIVHLIWPDVDAPIEHRTALDGLCAKVGYIGDTASLVQMWLEDAPPSATLVPTDPAHSAHRLRVPYAGRLNVLKEVHERDMRAGQYLPRDETFKWGHYREVESPEPAIPSSDFGEFIILRRVDGPSFAITDTLTLTQTLRDTVLSVWSDVVKQPIPEWISGHTADGKRSTRAKGHLALVALSNVGFEHSDGDVKGLAMAVPHDAPQDELDALLGALFPWDSDASEIRPAKLVMGRLGALSLAQMNQSRPKMVTLRRSLWLRPAQRWASVTPIVLDRYPKRDGDAENMVAQACQHIGLPTPRDVVLMPGSLFTGAPPAKRFAPLPQKSGKTIDQHTHALLIFDEPVRGPVLLGSGRYRGYGLCRPYGGTQEES